MSLFFEGESGVGNALEVLIIVVWCVVLCVLSLRCILLLQRTILYILDD